MRLSSSEQFKQNEKKDDRLRAGLTFLYILSLLIGFAILGAVVLQILKLF